MIFSKNFATSLKLNQIFNFLFFQICTLLEYNIGYLEDHFQRIEKFHFQVTDVQVLAYVTILINGGIDYICFLLGSIIQDQNR